MRWFFFGSLMDREILEIVLDRKIDPHAFEIAFLTGYDRRRVFGESYPGLQVKAGEVVDGVIAELSAPEDEARILFFEATHYRLADVRVRTMNDKTVDARTCLDAGAIDFEDRPWDFEIWRATEERERLVEITRRFMAKFGALSEDQADAEWTAIREAVNAEWADREGPASSAMR